MVRTIHTAEKNTVQQAPRIVACVATVATVIFPDQRYLQLQEIAYRYFQNVGSNRVYYSVGVGGAGSTVEVPVPQCNDTNVFHGYLEAGQILDCGLSLQMVSAYSPSGTTISTTLVFRN